MISIEASRAEQQQAMAGDGFMPEPMFTRSPILSRLTPPDRIRPRSLRQCADDLRSIAHDGVGIHHGR